MHEARVTYSRRGLFVLGAALLLAILALVHLLREQRNAARGANGAVAVTAVSSSPSDASAAENARRVAIAALGPIKRREGTNAADLYKQAMGLYAELTDEEKNMLKHWRNKADAKAAAALYANIQPIMDLLRAARKAEYLDWGMEPMTMGEPSGSAKMAQVKGVQDLGVLAAWDSFYRFQSDPDGAVGDVATMEAMGRSVVDSLIGMLAQNGIHSMGLWLIAQNAGAITSAAAPDIAYFVSPVAVEQSFQNGMNGEASMQQASLDQYANPATRNESAIQKWTSFGSISPASLISEFKWTIQTDQALGMTLTEPDAQFQQWWAQKLAEAASKPTPMLSLLASQGLQALADVRNVAQVSMVENSMFSAGFALEQDNQAQFQSIIDPASGKPFTYTQTANGFQLGSALQRNGKPVTLSFSNPAAK